MFWMFNLENNQFVPFLLMVLLFFNKLTCREYLLTDKSNVLSVTYKYETLEILLRRHINIVTSNNVSQYRNFTHSFIYNLTISHDVKNTKINHLLLMFYNDFKAFL